MVVRVCYLLYRIRHYLRLLSLCLPHYCEVLLGLKGVLSVSLVEEVEQFHPKSARPVFV